VTQRIPLAELPESVVWAATELELLDDNNTLSRSHFRTLGEFLLRYGGGNSAAAQAKAALYGAMAMSVADLLAAQDVNPQGVAVALNGAVLPRGRWAETRLNDGDELHLFTAIAGG
jgi:sulfur carrier protein